jgi:hypothetical protein
MIGCRVRELPNSLFPYQPIPLPKKITWPLEKRETITYLSVPGGGIGSTGITDYRNKIQKSFEIARIVFMMRGFARV